MSIESDSESPSFDEASAVVQFVAAFLPAIPFFVVESDRCGGTARESGKRAALPCWINARCTTRRRRPPVNDDALHGASLRMVGSRPVTSSVDGTSRDYLPPPLPTAPHRERGKDHPRRGGKFSKPISITVFFFFLFLPTQCRRRHTDTGNNTTTSSSSSSTSGGQLACRKESLLC